MIETGEKKVKKKKKSNAGRPSVVTPEVVAKLEYGFSKGLTDLEACLYADISKDALYNYIAKNPEFSDRKELLKNQPKIKAKLNITDSIEAGDANDSKWYLERKAKDEFSIRQEVDQNSKIEMKAEISALDSLNNLLDS